MVKKKSGMQRMISCLLTVCLIVGMFPAAAFAAGSNVVTYPVTGGYIYFDKSTGTVTDCDTRVTRAEIPELIGGVIVTKIKALAFADCSNLNQIALPDSVIEIGSSAFLGCNSLDSIAIPNGVTEIEDNTFSNCSSLSNIMIPNSVVVIGYDAFSGCSSLKSIDIPESVTTIRDSAFIGCGSLNSITIPESVTTIGSYVFSGCSDLKTAGPIDGGYDYEFGWKTAIPASAFNGCDGLTSISIPDSITEIGMDAFVGCSSLNSIMIPDKVTEIGTNAFNSCSSLISIVLPESMTKIQWAEFCYCSNLRSITIPDTITEIEDYAFYGCENLKDVYYAGSKTQWSAISIGTNNDPLTEATIHFNSKMPLEQGLHIYTDVPSRIVTIKDTFSIGAVTTDEEGNSMDLSDITFIVEDDNILQPQNVYEKDGVQYCNFQANSAGSTRVRIRDANADRAANISFTVEPVTGNAYTINNFHDVYKNGLQIENSRVSENSDGSCNISFDVYNSLYLYGAVEVYGADGQLKDAEYIDKWADVAGIKDVVSYICEIALVSAGQSDWKELASAETHIDVEVPKGGYILISANPKESVVCSMLNSMDLIWQYMDYMGKLKDSMGSEKQLPKVIIQKIQEESDSFPAKWSKAFFNEAFQESITSETGVQDFVKGLVNVLMSNDLDQMVASTLAETIEGSATDLFTDWFTTAAGPAGIAIDGIFLASNAFNTIIQTAQFCKYSDVRFITVQVPDGDKRSSSDITVECDMDDNTALSVYKIDVEESKKYLVSIADIESQNVKPGNPEDGPGYHRPTRPSDVEIFSAHEIELVTGIDNYTPEGNVKVILPLPEELKGYTGRIKVYRIEEDGSATILWGVSDGTRISVVTDHFSVYIIASTSVEENDAEDGGYTIDFLQLLDSDGQALDSIPDGGFYAEVNLTKEDSAKDAVAVLTVYSKNGQMLDSYYLRTGEKGGSYSLNTYVANTDGEAGEIRAFILSSIGNPEPLCPSVSVSDSSATS